MKMFLKILGVISALQGITMASAFWLIVFVGRMSRIMNSTIEAGWTYTVFGAAMLAVGELAIWASEKLK